MRAGHARASARALAVVVCVLGALVGCRRDAPEAPKPEAFASAEASTKDRKGPPEVPFVAPQPWRSSKDPTITVSPPDPASETWRAFVNQHQPIQRPTPKWQPLPATKTVSLEMPEGSRFACVVTPLRIEAQANDFGTKLLAFVLTRELLCSSDGWQTWTSSVHEVRAPAEGERSRTFGSLHLRELRQAGKAGKERQTYATFVLVRDDEERRQAAPGPPRILEGVVVDED